MACYITDPISKQSYDISHLANNAFEILPYPISDNKDLTRILHIIYHSSQSRLVIHLTYTGNISKSLNPFTLWCKIIQFAIRSKGKSNVTIVSPPYISNATFHKKRLIGRLKHKLRYHCNRYGIRYYDVPQHLDQTDTSLSLSLRSIETNFANLCVSEAWGYRKLMKLA